MNGGAEDGRLGGDPPDLFDAQFMIRRHFARLLLIPFALAACGHGAKGDTIVIGVTGPFSQPRGVSMKAGAELAAADPDEWINAERIGTAQGIPTAFLLNILAVLRAKGLVESRRGVEGGYRLARPAAEISVADIIRAIDGPLANISGSLVEDMHYTGAATSLRDTWVALRATMRTVLEEVSLESIASGKLPKHVKKLLAEDESWVTRERPE